jgi:hypothetical protein
MFSKSSHLLQYRVELHDQYYRKGHTDQTKVHRLSLLDHDLLSINNKIWGDGNQTSVGYIDAAVGAIIAIRILNLCNKNASQAFMCDGEAEPTDPHALLIAGNGLSKAIREFGLKGDVKYLKIIITVAMEMLSIYVRQCWAQDRDLKQVIVTQLDVEAEEELFHNFHKAEIDRLMEMAKSMTINQPTTSMLPM